MASYTESICNFQRHGVGGPVPAPADMMRGPSIAMLLITYYKHLVICFSFRHTVRYESLVLDLGCTSNTHAGTRARTRTLIYSHASQD